MTATSPLYSVCPGGAREAGPRHQASGYPTFRGQGLIAVRVSSLSGPHRGQGLIIKRRVTRHFVGRGNFRIVRTIAFSLV